ncbi:hypothetical protein HMN09_00790000 [Mycena chlorophos]|uniref:Uncharacterized protein n=1 Tax=Mycena chlorophos TaxID=658473 RepID=A0A8H6SUA8_MYCCL|nr:hypothetical protein HMN09_00790000 [Mycena chlorophos]
MDDQARREVPPADPSGERSRRGLLTGTSLLGIHVHRLPPSHLPPTAWSSSAQSGLSGMRLLLPRKRSNSSRRRSLTSGTTSNANVEFCVTNTANCGTSCRQSHQVADLRMTPTGTAISSRSTRRRSVRRQTPTLISLLPHVLAWPLTPPCPGQLSPSLIPHRQTRLNPRRAVSPVDVDMPSVEDTACESPAPWPTGWFYCDIAAGFVAMDAVELKGLSVGARFERVFGRRHVPQTYGDNRRKWNNAPEALRQEFGKAGRTAGGLWSAFSRRIAAAKKNPIK